MINRRKVLQTAAGFTAIGLSSAAKSQESIMSLLPVVQPLSSSAPSAAIQSTNVSISVDDSPLKNALAIYYDFLVDLTKGFQEQKQKLLLNNTITSFDISKDTPYYNEELFRQFADRVYKSSPDDLSNANRADRFSLHYQQIVQTAAASIDRKYPQILRDISDLQNKLEDQTTKLNNRISAINKQWIDLANATGVTPSDPMYELKLITYREQIRYADQIDQYSQNIDMILSSMNAVRRTAYSPSEQALLDDVDQLTKTKLIARPRRPNFERSVPGVNEYTFADPTYRAESIVDIAPSAFPIGDLVKFLDTPGGRQLSISKTSATREQHDRTWSIGGRGSFSIFSFSVGGSAGSSGSSSYIQQINSSNGIDISFENIAEYLVERDLWFNPGVFQDRTLQPILSKLPGYDRLENVSVSLIIARGTTITLKFDNAVDTNSWSKQAFSASGGVSIFGFGFGGSGSNSRYDSTITATGDKKGVTFKDDPQLCRLLAVRLESFVPLAPAASVASVNDALSRFQDGKIGYLEYQKAKF